jgi:hypothetical protein
MNAELKTLCEQAGFVFWDDEDRIDWACNYDQEIQNLFNLMKERYAQIQFPKNRPG